MRRKLVGALGLLVAFVLAIGIQGDVSAATSLNTSIKIIVAADFTNSQNLVTSQSNLRQSYALTLTNGVIADQGDMVWADQRTLTASATEDLDVSGGALTDAFGTAFTLVKVKALIVCAAAGNTNDVVILGDANSVPILDTAATTHTIGPGGCFNVYDPTLGGWAVTAATGDIIQVTNSAGGTSVTYDIVIIGTSS